MRRRINKELLTFCNSFAGKSTVSEMLPVVNARFNENYTKLELQKYLVRNKVPYRYEMPSKVRKMGLDKPIGTEYTKPDGMVMVKVSRNKWVYKQRLIYENFYNVHLKDDEYVIFLDNNRNNFDINNLKVVSRHVASYLANQHFKSTDKDITSLGISVAELMIKIKEKENFYEKTVN